MRYFLLLAPVVLLAGPPRYARVGDFDGSVETQARAADNWIAAERNTPLPESARIRTGAASRVEIELDEGSVLRLGPESQCEISDYARLSTGQRVTLLSFDHGLAYVTGAPEGRDSLTLALPGAQVTFTRSARVRLQIEPQWSRVAVLRGAARFSSPTIDMELREGQSTRVEPANPERFFFYKEILPLDSDQWSGGRDDALGAPASAAHVIERYGVADLDTAGEWILSQDLGAMWRPKVAEDWRPYREGRWRWQDGLGYTWIAGERWGWLPYHYGRWTRVEKLGWVWVPSKNGVFKPGEVYWIRGKDYVAWGPLGPGEQWNPADPVNPMPQQFAGANSTYAAYEPNAATIDPAGFAGAPEDPLKDVRFLTALPSPPFDAARLDAVRPVVSAASLRVKPVVEGVTVETASAAPAPAAAAPVVVVMQPAPQAPPEPEVVGVPVPVPAGIVFVPTPPKKTAVAPVVTPAKATRQGASRPPKRYRGRAEQDLSSLVVRELEEREFQKALSSLDLWTERFRETEFGDERSYYYMLAFHGLNQPAKVIDRARPMVLNRVAEVFVDPMQALSVVYLTAANFQRLPRPTREESGTAREAAAQLLGLLPECFSPERRPAAMTSADWVKSREDLAALARQIMARARR